MPLLAAELLVGDPGKPPIEWVHRFVSVVGGDIVYWLIRPYVILLGIQRNDDVQRRLQASQLRLIGAVKAAQQTPASRALRDHGSILATWWGQAFSILEVAAVESGCHIWSEIDVCNAGLRFAQLRYIMKRVVARNAVDIQERLWRPQGQLIKRKMARDLQEDRGGGPISGPVTRSKRARDGTPLYVRWKDTSDLLIWRMLQALGALYRQ